ncbi:MAG: exodeoxyribonuclease VII small subunit [Chromatiales bacterium]
MARKKTTNEPVDFEQALRDLEALVERLEAGELTLEQSLNEFERGVALTRRCQQALSDAEQRVKILTEQGQELDFDPEANDDVGG